MRDQPLSEVVKSLTRALFIVQLVFSKALRNYILSLVPLVEENVKTLLPDKFGLMFDGWSDSTVHYVALFATYIHDGTYCETLLSCSPLLEETELTADQHKDYIIDQ